MKSIFFNIEQNCGDNIENIQYYDPGNDPNFVFENDPLFETILPGKNLSELGFGVVSVCTNIINI